MKRFSEQYVTCPSAAARLTRTECAASLVSLSHSEETSQYTGLCEFILKFKTGTCFLFYCF